MHFFPFVLGLIFLTIVAPIWIIAHYLVRWRATRTISREDQRTLGELFESLKRVEARIEILEKILDEEAPGWRTSP
ncbi:MAG: envelope stress response membrane protein PspB [Stellaceae bacterium]